MPDGRAPTDAVAPLQLLQLRARPCFWETAVADNGGPLRGRLPHLRRPCRSVAAPRPGERADVPLPPPAPTPLPPPYQDKAGKPVVIGYEVLEDLGRTSTGVMQYRAKQTVLNRLVVLKTVLARDDPSQQAWGTLRGEAAALAKVPHPNIVGIFEAGDRDRQLFYNAVELRRRAEPRHPPRRQAVASLARRQLDADRAAGPRRSLRPREGDRPPWSAAANDPPPGAAHRQEIHRNSRAAGLHRSRGAVHSQDHRVRPGAHPARRGGRHRSGIAGQVSLLPRARTGVGPLEGHRASDRRFRARCPSLRMPDRAAAVQGQLAEHNAGADSDDRSRCPSPKLRKQAACSADVAARSSASACTNSRAAATTAPASWPTTSATPPPAVRSRPVARTSSSAAGNGPAHTSDRVRHPCRRCCSMYSVSSRH